VSNKAPNTVHQQEHLKIYENIAIQQRRHKDTASLCPVEPQDMRMYGGVKVQLHASALDGNQWSA
jgi:hypothetical protein